MSSCPHVPPTPCHRISTSPRHSVSPRYLDFVSPQPHVAPIAHHCVPVSPRCQRPVSLCCSHPVLLCLCVTPIPWHHGPSSPRHRVTPTLGPFVPTSPCPLSPGSRYPCPPTSILVSGVASVSPRVSPCPWALTPVSPRSHQCVPPLNPSSLVPTFVSPRCRQPVPPTRGQLAPPMPAWCPLGVLSRRGSLPTVSPQCPQSLHCSLSQSVPTHGVPSPLSVPAVSSSCPLNLWGPRPRGGPSLGVSCSLRCPQVVPYPGVVPTCSVPHPLGIPAVVPQEIPPLVSPSCPLSHGSPCPWCPLSLWCPRP